MRFSIVKKQTFGSAVCLAGMCIAFQAAAATCEVAEILFGPIQLDIVEYDGYETAIVRSATFDDPLKPYGAILGELTVDRGGFAVRKASQLVVGTISPDLKIEGWDDVCDSESDVEIIRAKEGAYIILNNNQPVGTIAGRFPKNGFNVE